MQSALDVGCGTGGTTLALARRLGHGARCTGIDIAQPAIASAQAHARQEGLAMDFVCADAQRHRFAPGTFDVIMSRFGVMFFDDPVAAFANLRGATRAGGRLLFLAWRAADENPFMTAAERAARPLLPGLPMRQPDEAGQFGFAGEARVREIVSHAAWGRWGGRSKDAMPPCVSASSMRCGLPSMRLSAAIRCRSGRLAGWSVRRQARMRAIKASSRKYDAGDGVHPGRPGTP